MGDPQGRPTVEGPSPPLRQEGVTGCPPKEGASESPSLVRPDLPRTTRSSPPDASQALESLLEAHVLDEQPAAGQLATLTAVAAAGSRPPRRAPQCPIEPSEEEGAACESEGGAHAACLCVVVAGSRCDSVRRPVSRRLAGGHHERGTAGPPKVSVGSAAAVDTPRDRLDPLWYRGGSVRASRRPLGRRGSRAPPQ